MQQFYWPTVYQDVKDACQTCPKCQTKNSRKETLCSTDSHIAIWRSSSSELELPVIVQLAIQKPFPSELSDAEHTAEELFKFLGVSREILMD